MVMFNIHQVDVTDVCRRKRTKMCVLTSPRMAYVKLSAIDKKNRRIA
jgi:hypothetical protein